MRRESYDAHMSLLSISFPCDSRKSSLSISAQSLHDAKYVMRSLRSAFFFNPANTIFVPGIIFLGFTKYLFSVFLSHVSPELRFAAEYENEAMVPDVRPTIPHKLGPCPLGPPLFVLWHCAHLAWKILAPFSADMIEYVLEDRA